ncbi:iron-sulfur cluster assembly scaffold protein [Methanonatronarchaeum sp. AMET6-2]|uniref:iron-sulfur cluster assembly scaffold protein n=1 Tax=Methanonatronarchaeum sp. AMET6-2 TaxID=2933293 RepID=UPI00120F2402|nr:iron-sulfur cluster assembly scaffold protein [Methanonatronarchaeum sp. AMET6-2]RZN62902.1 MAG: iron-sulfur cluster assembly scaffold protein [Methanonatronarchaeia archaeon]UOY09832.1 iron-sulfur cluster assembly scaffold protein [Methanonatronarchaeum sp. AMET6-2]
MYSDKVMEHFKNPRNMGEMENPDAEAKVGNPACGDLMRIYLKVGEKEGEKIIEDISFKTFGCAAAIATSSVTTELVKGKKLDEAEKLTRDDVAEELGGLPKVKMHCSNLAASGLHRAIYEYKKKAGMEISDDLEKKYKASEAALEKTEEKMDELE